MERLGQLSPDLQRRYDWECSSCNHVFQNQGSGLKCPKCGGQLRKIVSPELVKEKTIGD